MSEDCRTSARGAALPWASHVSTALVLVTLLIGLPPAPASAQYMFLDVNGNGIADDFWDFFQSDSSTVDVYLVTDHTLYGDPAYCQPAPGLRSYTVNLYCPQAAATFTNIRNLMPGMSETFPAVVTKYGITVAYSGSNLFPPGKYLLFRVDVKPDRTSFGCPDVEIQTSDCFAPDGVVTSFGSGCINPDGNDILRYGLEWFDAVGVGGCTDFPGRVPVVTCPVAVTGRELQPFSFPVSVFDPDCSIFSFYSSRFPSGASFVGSGPIRDGIQGGTLVWTPARGQAGTYSIH